MSASNISDPLWVGIIITIIFFLLLIGTYIYSAKITQDLSQNDRAKYQQDNTILKDLTIALYIVGIVSIVGFVLGKNSSLVIPIPI